MKKLLVSAALAALAAAALAGGTARGPEGEAALIGPCTGCQAPWGSHE